MDTQDRAGSSENGTGTDRKIGTLLTQSGSRSVPMTTLEDTRRDLIGIREQHGADTAIGHCCSNLVELVQNFAKESDPLVKEGIASRIIRKNARLAKLLAAARH